MSTLIDQTAVDALGKDAGVARAKDIVSSYLATLDERVYLLRTALASANTARALVALRGLHSASAMVGARDLAEITSAVEPALRGGNARPVRDALPEIMELAVATREALLEVVSAPA